MTLKFTHNSASSQITNVCGDNPIVIHGDHYINHPNQRPMACHFWLDVMMPAAYADGYFGATKNVVYIMPAALVPNVGIPPYSWQSSVLVDNAAKLQPVVATHASGQVTRVATKAALMGSSEVN